MTQVKAARGHKVGCPDLRDWIDADNSPFCRHRIHHHAVEPTLERVLHAGTAIEVHIQDFSYKCVFIFWLYNTVAALGEIGLGILRHRLQRCVDLTIIVIGLAAHRLVLKNQEKPAGQCLTATFLPDELDSTTPQFPAGRYVLALNVRLQPRHILVRIRFAGYGLKLQAHGRNFKPAGKRRDNAPLLLIGAKQKVDGFNFQDFEVPAICSFNDPVSDLFEGNVVLYELQTGGCFLPTAWAFAPTGVSCV